MTNVLALNKLLSHRKAWYGKCTSSTCVSPSLVTKLLLILVIVLLIGWTPPLKASSRTCSSLGAYVEVSLTSWTWAKLRGVKVCETYEQSCRTYQYTKGTRTHCVNTGERHYWIKGLPRHAN